MYSTYIHTYIPLHTGKETTGFRDFSSWPPPADFFFFFLSRQKGGWEAGHDRSWEVGGTGRKTNIQEHELCMGGFMETESVGREMPRRETGTQIFFFFWLSAIIVTSGGALAAAGRVIT